MASCSSTIHTQSNAGGHDVAERACDPTVHRQRPNQGAWVCIAPDSAISKPLARNEGQSRTMCRLDCSGVVWVTQVGLVAADRGAIVKFGVAFPRTKDPRFSAGKNDTALDGRQWILRAQVLRGNQVCRVSCAGIDDRTSSVCVSAGMYSYEISYNEGCAIARLGFPACRQIVCSRWKTDERAEITRRMHARR